MIEFTFHGEPVAQGRPRMTTICGHPVAYDPAKSKEFKQYVRLESVRAMRGREILEEALILSVRVYRAVPKSFSKRKVMEAEQGLLRPVTKPDIDNYLKSVMDGMTGVVWKDDNQVVGYERTGKFYTSQAPRVWVRVWTFSELLTKKEGHKNGKTEEDGCRG